ncbi:MAG: orotate phosphoribosyltransferase, partial [Pseudomonadota bacterium]
MTLPTSFPTDEEMARLTARMLIETGAVNFRPEDPFTLASGKRSPVYLDCRCLISYPRVRS